MKHDNDRPAQFAQFGILSLIPGMQYMIERMQRELDELRKVITNAQGHEYARGIGLAGVPREGGFDLEPIKRKYVKKSDGRGSGWPADPEARKVEMKRRMLVHAEKNKGANHPRDPRHPGHDKWIANLRKAQKKAWNSLTATEKAAKIARMTKASVVASKKRKKSSSSVRSFVNGAASSMEKTA
jgi:hypothetical protein